MTKSYEELLAEIEVLSAKNEELHRSLDESQELLQAISSGEVDALVLTGSEGEQVYTLEGADRAYRVLIEAMNDGAVTMNSDGTVLYCNRHFAEMVRSPLEKVIGSSIYRFIPQADQTAFRVLQKSLGRGELALQAEDESIIPVYISINALQLSESQEAFCVVITDLTEQKHKEEIVAAEKLARSIIEQATEAVVVCDEEGKVIRFSNAASGILGCDPSLQSFEDLFDLHLPNGKKLSPVSMALQGEVLLQVEANFKRTDGLQFHLLLNSGPLKSANGKIIGCVVTLTDITERKRTEEELKESETRLQAVIDNLPIGIWFADGSGKILFGNEAGQKIWSGAKYVGPEEFHEYKAWWADTGLPLGPEDWAVVRAVRKGETSLNEVLDIECFDGTRKTILNSAVPLRSSDGQIFGVVVLNEDITERKRAEEALQRLNTELEHRVQERTTKLVEAGKKVQAERQRFLDMLDTLPVIIDIIRPDYQIEWANRAYREALGDNQGRLCFESQFGRDKPCEECQAFIPLDTGQPHHWEWTLPNGRTFDIYNFPFADAEGSPVILEMDIDITERKKAEAQLIKAKEAAEAAVKAKSLFLANMSHELRTPMNAVIGFTGLLLDEPLSPEHKDYLESIRNSGQALLALINDLLDFSRMEREDVEIEDQPFDLRTIVEESLDQVAAEASKKNLDLAYSIDKDMPEAITGDPARLRQVLVNLLGNAVKYTDEGEAVLSVLPKGQDEILFEIRDTGIGIPEDKVNILFQPFSRADESFSSRYEGAGLGLAISKKLVEMMGGRIWVESAPGRGSTFSFTIKAKAVPGKPKAVPTGVQPKLEGKNVLIVDDNKTNRIILGKLLNSWGIIPVPKPSGQEARALIKGGAPFDVAILDMMMPEMDGVALAKEIRKYRKDLPLILLSSVGQKGVPGLFEAVLNKPIKPAQLHKVLSDTLAARQPREEAESFGAEASRSPMRILLAEDNVSNQKVTLAMLKKLGYRADAVANGAEALQALERQHYDLILMDIKMPVLGGLEATRMIRERWPDNGPKIIAITAYALHGDKEKCLAAGMDGYIPKPVQKEDLAEVIGKYSPETP